MADVPTLSLANYIDGDAASRAAFSEDLMHGLQRYGFFILKDHPISAAVLDKAYDLSAAFFAQPESEKLKYRGGQRGYTPFGVEHAKNTQAVDLKEFWQIGPERAANTKDYGEISPPNLWPAYPPEFKETFIDLFNGLQRTGEIILEALAPHLGLNKSYFTPLVADGNSVLRLLHYPPTPPKPEGVRAEAHEDINVITLLLGAEEAGLQLLTAEGEWLDVDPPQGALVVNVGDMLQRLTNHRLRSTTHRVVNPASGAEDVVRYSMPFFVHPYPECMLRIFDQCVTPENPKRYPDITADDFLKQRLREIGLIK